MTEPYASGMLNVGDGNQIYWESCGNPDGKPLVLLHGGPGQGCNEAMRDSDHADLYRIVLYDQRGCGHSTPHAADPATDMRFNTTAHLVADLEILREHLGIDRWFLCGGSWGCTLALAYAQRYPHRVSEIVLSAITTTRRREIDWLYGGVSRFFPEQYQQFLAGAGGGEHVVAAYDRLLGHSDRDVRERATAAWAQWEETVLSVEPGAKPSAFSGPVTDDLLAMVRICAHFYAHYGWLKDGELIRNAGALADIPGVLVHGRLDLSCPVETAYELATAWPGTELIVCDQSGHLGSPAKREYIHNALTRFAH